MGTYHTFSGVRLALIPRIRKSNIVILSYVPTLGIVLSPDPTTAPPTRSRHERAVVHSSKLLSNDVPRVLTGDIPRTSASPFRSRTLTLPQPSRVHPHHHRHRHRVRRRPSAPCGPLERRVLSVVGAWSCTIVCAPRRCRHRMFMSRVDFSLNSDGSYIERCCTRGKYVYAQ